jgi:protein-L-isoaspartate(D-aspartate) O-methyltransferase
MAIQNGQADELVGQLRKRGITDAHVLAAIQETPREKFVGPREAAAAYCDTALPIECGQTISQPYIVAYMTQQLAIEPGDEILEIGTGSGYQAAILSRLAAHVYTIERHAPLLEEAAGRFKALGVGNITAITADGSKGWPERRQFDRIIVTAAASKLPQALVDQLKDGGRMILPLGGPICDQRLVVIDKTEGKISQRDLLPVRFVPLVPRPSKS